MKKSQKQTFEMSRKETIVQYTKLVMGLYALILLTLIAIRLWK